MKNLKPRKKEALGLRKRNRTNSLFNLIIVIWIALFAIVICSAIVEASETSTLITIEPSDVKGQYFELRATSLKDVPGEGRQLIMELWGHDIDFKRISCKISV